MSIRKQVIRGGMIALAISAVAVLAFAWGHVNPEGAQAEGPGMSLDAPGTVYVGETFLVTVNADPAPDVEVAIFGSEVVFPEGLKWEQRASCPDEVLPRQEGSGAPPALCQAGLSTILGGARHAVISSISLPVIPLDIPLGVTSTLVELDFVCNTAGSYKLTLVSDVESPDGATFGDTEAVPIPMKLVEGSYDADGDTTPETHQVAATLTIECSDEPPPTATPPPTVTPGPTDAPTDVPQDTPEPTTVVGGVSAGFGPIDGDGGVSAGLWAVIGALLAAAATGLIILGWPKHAQATVSATIATPGLALPATSRVSTGTNFGLWPIVGAVVATGLTVFGWKFTRRGR